MELRVQQRSISEPGPAAAPPGAPDAAPGDAELVARLQRLFDEVERIGDPAARHTAKELLGAVLELHGEGLARIGAALDAAGEAGGTIKGALVEDSVVASLLLIHDLYPVDLEERVRGALDGVRPYMESHGGDVEVLSVSDGVARLKLQGSCDGCPASSATLELAIKQALEEAAPDLVGLEVEGVTEPGPGPQGDLSGTALPMIETDTAIPPNGATAEPNGSHAPRSRWIAPEGLVRPGDGEIAITEADGTEMLIANVSGSLLAFRDACAGCGSKLSDGELKGGVLACPSCERRFYLPRAGRSMDAEQLLLDPVPLLDSGGQVTVAVST